MHGPAARSLRIAAAETETVYGQLSMIPDMGVDLHFWGLGGDSKVTGGTMFANEGHFLSSIKNIQAMIEEGHATTTAKTAGYERRADDWLLQSNLAARELVQIGRQLISSLIAEQVAKHEYDSTKAQIAQSQATLDLLDSKFTSEELFNWMQGETSRLYYGYYRIALDVARRAERTAKFQLRRPEFDQANWIGFNYWDAGRRGLLSGEALFLDLKRMELAFAENNKREYELTKHVSLRQLDPTALLSLKVNGVCEFSIPEWLFDRDTPGHYMRQIKSVAVSIPSVVGPFTGINPTVTLLRSQIRTRTGGDEYPRSTDGEDDRFQDIVGAIESIVTSNATNDNGLFEANLHDERFLPFEGAGAVSSWRIELPGSSQITAKWPTALRAFDYATIADVVLQIRYTARPGGDEMAKSAVDAATDVFGAGDRPGLALLLDLPHDFATEWSVIASPPDPPAAAPDLEIQLRKEQFPYLAQAHEISVDSIEVVVPTKGGLDRSAFPVPGTLADDLNGSRGAALVTFQRTTFGKEALPREAFLVVRYSLNFNKP